MLWVGRIVSDLVETVKIPGAGMRNNCDKRMSRAHFSSDARQRRGTSLPRPNLSIPATVPLMLYAC